MRKFLVTLMCFMMLLSGCVNNNVEVKDDLSNKTQQNENTQDKKDESQETSDEQTNDTQEKQDDVEVNNQPQVDNTSVLYQKIIVIDAGHGINSYNDYEPIGPGSSEMKIMFASGTSGANQTEEELNLKVALKLQKVLEEKGAIIHMTRTTHESDMTNVDRAEFANDLNADLSVKIHADGVDATSAHGVSVLIPGRAYIQDEELLANSRLAAENVLNKFVEKTGAYNRGIVVRNDLTGFNWSTVPIILIEMGFMTNPEEDRLMESEEYQDKMVAGMVEGIEEYFKNLDGSGD